MNDYIERIMGWPTWQRVAVWIGTLLAVIGIFWNFFYADLGTELQSVQEQVDKLNTDIVAEQRLARELPKVRKAVQQLDQRLKELVRELPDKREIPSLLSSISSLAKDAGLEVSLFKPRAEVIQDFYAEVPVSIAVEGAYHEVATFFDEVSRLDRVVNVSEILMTDPTIDRNTKAVEVKTNCVATTFRYLDDDERKAREEAMQQSGRRRRR